MTVIVSSFAQLAGPALVSLISVYLAALSLRPATRHAGTADLALMLIAGALLAPRVHALATTGTPVAPAPDSLAGWTVFVLAVVPVPALAALRLRALANGDASPDATDDLGFDPNARTARRARRARKQIREIRRRKDLDDTEKKLMIIGIDGTGWSSRRAAAAGARWPKNRRDLAIALALLILPGAVYALWSQLPASGGRAVYYVLGWAMLSGEEARTGLTGMAALTALAAPALLIIAHDAARRSRLDANTDLAIVRVFTGWLALPAGALLPGGLIANEIAAVDGPLAASLIGLSAAAAVLAVPFASHGAGTDWQRFFARAGLLSLGLVGPSLLMELSSSHTPNLAFAWLGVAATALVATVYAARRVHAT